MTIITGMTLEEFDNLLETAAYEQYDRKQRKGERFIDPFYRYGKESRERKPKTGETDTTGYRAAA